MSITSVECVYIGCEESEFKYMGTGKVVHSCVNDRACRECSITVQHHTEFDIECNGFLSCYGTNFMYFGDIISTLTHSCKGQSACSYSRVTTFGPLIFSCDGSVNGNLPCEGMSFTIINYNQISEQHIQFTFSGNVATAQSPIRIFSVYGLKQSQIICINGCSLDAILIIYGFKFDKSCKASNDTCFEVMNDILQNENDNLLIVTSYIENTFNYTQLKNQNILYIIPTLINFKLPLFGITGNNSYSSSYWLSIFTINVPKQTDLINNENHDLTMYDNVAITNLHGSRIWDTVFIGPKQQFLRNSYYQIWSNTGSINPNVYYLNATHSSKFNSVEYRSGIVYISVCNESEKHCSFTLASAQMILIIIN